MGVYWITGLSGAGKTTLARRFADRLKSSGISAVLLDGDELRELFGVEAGDANNHMRDTRLNLAFRYARLCKMLAAQQLTVIIATISMFREIHDWNRAHLPDYFEIYLKVPLDELRNRDPKGIYRRYDEGLLSNVAGLDLVVDEPEAPDWLLDFDSGLAIEDVLDKLTEKALERNKR